MSPKELEQFVNSLTWKPIGEGSFNRASVSNEYAKIGSFRGQFVLKYPHAEEDHDSKELNNPARGARKLRTIYPHYPIFHTEGYRLSLCFEDTIPTDTDVQKNIVYVYLNHQQLEAAVIHPEGMLQRIPLNNLSSYENIMTSFQQLLNLSDTVEHHKLHLSLEHEHQIFEALNLTRESLLMPYFGHKQATRNQIARAVLAVYQRTRNIVIDACAPGNFLVYKQEVILVDPDQAYNRHSPVSMAFFNDPEVKENVEKHWQQASRQKKHEDPVVAVIKTLLYLESQLKQPEPGPLSRSFKTPDIVANDYVSEDMIVALHAFRKNKWPLNTATLETMSLITTQCKNNSLTSTCPEITPTFVKDVQNALMYSDKSTTVFIKQLLSSKTPPRASESMPAFIKPSALRKKNKSKTKLLSSHQTTTSSLHQELHVEDKTNNNETNDDDALWDIFDISDSSPFQLLDNIERSAILPINEDELSTFTSNVNSTVVATTQHIMPKPITKQLSHTAISVFSSSSHNASHARMTKKRPHEFNNASSSEDQHPAKQGGNNSFNHKFG